MNDLIKRNYDSIVKRGLICNTTTPNDFIMKLEEEVQEFIDAQTNHLENRDEELADVILVCLNIAKHYDIDIEKELNRKVEKNYKRHGI